MSLTLNASCPSANSLPDFGPNLPTIPLNFNIGITPATNGTLEPMKTCCASGVVEVAEGCYYWCKLPTNATEAGPFYNCLSANNAHNRENGSSITGFHKASGASSIGKGSGMMLAVGISWVMFVAAM